ncbi:MAG TPA: DPP IV N-terminal domain-containing protein [Kiritimatiellia bacterium]|nr:DPP IV N-terminal domain-containing protein [Kiritimatiellia bacterium]
MHILKSCLIILLASTFAAYAQQADITIAKGTARLSFDPAPFAASDPSAQLFIQVLSDNLVRSKSFARGRAGQADYSISGSATSQGGRFRADIRVTARGATSPAFTRTYQQDAAGIRRAAHEAADDILLALTGRKGMASAQLVLVGNRTGHKELYIADADGQGLYQLTADNSLSLSPSWSPDGSRIFYTSYLRTFPAIFEVNLQTRGRNRIANYAGLNTGGIVSPNGRQMALILSRDGNPELYVKNLADNSLTRLTRTPRAVESSPSWSPDGRQIVYVSDVSGRPQLYIISATGGEPRRLTHRNSQNVSPDWGPNNKIAHAGLVGGRFHIFVIDPVTGATEQITSGNHDFEEPSWAPDGRHLAAKRTIQYASRVVLLDTMGEPPIVLVDQPGDWSSPRWSPGR